MSVYVDNYRGRLGRMLMAHLVADTHDELMRMAARLNLNPDWIQSPGTPREHFDVSLRKRDLAVRHGAVEVSSRDIVRILRERKMDVYMGAAHV